VHAIARAVTRARRPRDERADATQSGAALAGVPPLYLAKGIGASSAGALRRPESRARRRNFVPHHWELR
jgi:hypothetical protein